MIDTNAILCQHLKTAGSGLYALVGTRIYCPRVPAGFTNTAAALEVMRRTGTSKREHEMHEVSFQIKCFGGTNSHASAEAVYRALWDRIHGAEGVTVTDGFIIQAFEDVSGQSLFDPDSGWPYVLSFWTVTMRPTA